MQFNPPSYQYVRQTQLLQRCASLAVQLLCETEIIVTHLKKTFIRLFSTVPAATCSAMWYWRQNSHFAGTVAGWILSNR